MITKGKSGMIKINAQAFIEHQKKVLREDWKNTDMYRHIDEKIKGGACEAMSLSHVPKVKGGWRNSIVERLIEDKDDIGFEMEYFDVVELGMRDYVGSKLKSSVSQRIWLHRYCLARTMKQTAEAIGHCLSHTKRLHKKMLQELESAIYIVYSMPEFNNEEVREYFEEIGAIIKVPREAVLEN